MSMFENIFRKKEEGAEVGVIDDKKIEKAMKRIDKDEHLKKVYDSWMGKKDSRGRDMQEKLLEFLAKNPGMDPVYRPETEEFEIRDYQGMN